MHSVKVLLLIAIRKDRRGILVLPRKLFTPILKIYFHFNGVDIDNDIHEFLSTQVTDAQIGDL